MPRLVLASASPARRTTLQRGGIDPIVIVSGVDESQLSDLPPAALALALAELKCSAVLDHHDVPTDALVLGCDSVLEFDGQVHGKPEDADEAIERWRRAVVVVEVIQADLGLVGDTKARTQTPLTGLAGENVGAPIAERATGEAAEDGRHCR